MTSDSWPEEAAPLPSGTCSSLVRSFESVASRFPERIAVLHVAANSTASPCFSARPSGHGPDAGETPMSESIRVDSLGGEDIGEVGGLFDGSIRPKWDDELQDIHFTCPAFRATQAGDVVYTYGELLSAVGSLAELLCHVLGNGSDAPAAIEGTGLQGTVWEDYALLEMPEAFTERTSGLGFHENSTCGTGDALPRDGASKKRIGIMMVQSAEYLVSLLAVLMNGAAFVPLDLSWPPGRLKTVVQTSKPCLVIFCHHISWFPQRDMVGMSRISANFSCPILVLRESFMKAVNKKAPVRQDSCQCNADKTSYAYVLYTSGSTGNPKGVCGTEIGLMNRLRWMEETYPHVHDDVGCFKTAIGFVDHLTEALGPLLAGRPLIVPAQNRLARNPLALFDVLQDYPITRLVAVPSLLRALLPRLQERKEGSIPLALRLLVLSGEPLPIWLLKALNRVLLNTRILNLYGSTEVSGDCMYFDCSLLHDGALETSAVPIGSPISGCGAFVVSGSGCVLASGEGELWVTGAGVAQGYLDDSEETSKRFLRTWPSQVDCRDTVLLQCLQYPIFKTGDFVRLLPDGNILLLGRNDRLVKLHGQRLELEEVEAILQLHSAVMHAAVSTLTSPNGELLIVAYVVPTTKTSFVSKNASERNKDILLREGDGCALLQTQLMDWLLDRLPSVMIPHQIVLLKAMPLTSSGKVNHVLLSELLPTQGTSVEHVQQEDFGELRKFGRVFAHVLNLDQVGPFDDFFALGGTSVSAAHVAHKLNIDMHLLYSFPTPNELWSALSSMQTTSSHICTAALQDVGMSPHGEVSKDIGGAHSRKIATELSVVKKLSARMSRPKKRKHGVVLKLEQTDEGWPSCLVFEQPTALTRCNNFIVHEPATGHTAVANIDVPLDEPRKLEVSWKFSLNSCVDGSPLLVSTADDKWRLFIGSHGKNVVCLDAASGQVLWETQVGGRIESSAVLSFDFRQIGVGCYDGLIYFLDFWTGSIVWTFKTGGEVKCQPTVDSSSGWIWCGSHDHKIYALDTIRQQCVWEHCCGGSVFGAPALDKVKKRVYVASTGGTITAIHTEPSPRVLWTARCDAPVFGSLTVDPSSHFLICALVNGAVTAFTADGVAAWKVLTQGPVFAGACLSSSLPGQLLVCSRDGCIYAMKPDSGQVMWKHCFEDPITASCYVDESLELLCRHDGASIQTSRLVGICTTGGTVSVLRIKTGTSPDVIPVSYSFVNIPCTEWKQSAVTAVNPLRQYQPIFSSDNTLVGYEVAKFNLPGEVFSSPVIVGGRLFVGCRDNHVYALDLR